MDKNSENDQNWTVVKKKSIKKKPTPVNRRDVASPSTSGLPKYEATSSNPIISKSGITLVNKQQISHVNNPRLDASVNASSTSNDEKKLVKTSTGKAWGVLKVDQPTENLFTQIDYNECGGLFYEISSDLSNLYKMVDRHIEESEKYWEKVNKNHSLKNTKYKVKGQFSTEKEVKIRKFLRQEQQLMDEFLWTGSCWAKIGEQYSESCKCLVKSIAHDLKNISSVSGQNNNGEALKRKKRASTGMGGFVINFEHLKKAVEEMDTSFANINESENDFILNIGGVQNDRDTQEKRIKIYWPQIEKRNRLKQEIGEIIKRIKRHIIKLQLTADKFMTVTV